MTMRSTSHAAGWPYWFGLALACPQVPVVGSYNALSVGKVHHQLGQVVRLCSGVRWQGALLSVHTFRCRLRSCEPVAMAMGML
jgi:hypothetical protein